MTGRPTDYSQDVIANANHYLRHYEEEGDAVPSVAGLSLFLKKARSTIYEWAKDPEKKDFSDILDRINATQERVALSKGLKGDFNSQIVKLLLGKHGYHDKVDQELTGANRGPVEVGWNLIGVKPDAN